MVVVANCCLKQSGPVIIKNNCFSNGPPVVDYFTITAWPVKPYSGFLMNIATDQRKASRKTNAENKKAESFGSL